MTQIEHCDEFVADLIEHCLRRDGDTPPGGLVAPERLMCILADD